MGARDPMSTVVGAQRKDWVSGSQVQIYSHGQDQWFMGKIRAVQTDDQGEWLTVVYETTTDEGILVKHVKETQRYYEDVRPIQAAVTETIDFEEDLSDLDQEQLQARLDLINSAVTLSNDNPEILI